MESARRAVSKYQGPERSNRGSRKVVFIEAIGVTSPKRRNLLKDPQEQRRAEAQALSVRACERVASSTFAALKAVLRRRHSSDVCCHSQLFIAGLDVDFMDPSGPFAFQEARAPSPQRPPPLRAAAHAAGACEQHPSSNPTSSDSPAPRDTPPRPLQLLSPPPHAIGTPCSWLLLLLLHRVGGRRRRVVRLELGR